MAIEVTCPQCGKVYQVADQFAGRSAFCKSCGAQMQIAGNAPAAAPAGYDMSPAAVPPPVAAPMPPMPQAGVMPQQGAFFPRPPTPTAQPARTGGFRLTKFSLILLILGGMMVFFGVQEWRLASVASTTPQQISCLQLEKNGPGNNAYVTVDKFIITPGQYIYQKNTSGPEEWRRAWIPIIPKDGDYINQLTANVGKINFNSLPPLQNVKVLIKSSKVHNADDVRSLMHRGSITGMVVNKIESLEHQERAKLQEAYPQTDFSKCWIIEDGREPAQPSKYFGLMGGGGLLALIGLATMFKKS